MTYWDRIRECNAHDLSRHIAWRVGGQRVGHVRRDRAPLLVAAGMPFRCVGDELELLGEDFGERTERLARAMAVLAARGAVPDPLDESYPVAAPVRTEPSCAVDRRYVAWLGVAAAGVHVNGFLRAADGGLQMWIAERSRRKRTFPGMLDNMVAGGQPHGLLLRDNVVKECGEEAGIPPDLAARAVPVGAVGYVFEDETGLKPDTMFCYDLELPSEFVPECRDGEVESFSCLPVAEVARVVAASRRFKFNCNLVIIDFLVRHGIIDADDPGYVPLVHGLRQALGS